MMETNTIFIVLGVATIFLALWVLVLEIRLRKLMRGKDGASLEKNITSVLKDYETYAKKQNNIEDTLKTIEQKVGNSIRGVGHMRFNPFAGSGNSKPSFALALLDEKGNGVVVSTLHVRDGLSLFSKDIVAFASGADLTEEEQKALDKARDSLHNS